MSDTTETSDLVTIDEVELHHALYHKYPGQTAPQDAYLGLDCETGVLSCDYRVEVGSGLPAAVWNGHYQRWDIPHLTPAAANQLMADVLALAQRVMAGYESVWNGQTFGAQFTVDAVAAMEAIAELCEAENFDEGSLLTVWEADAWFPIDGSRDDGIESLVEYNGLTADSTDEDLHRILAEAEEEASNNDARAYIDGGLEWLKAARETLRERQRDVILDSPDRLDVREWGLPRELHDLLGDETVEKIRDALTDAYWTNVVKGWQEKVPHVRKVVWCPPHAEGTWMATNDPRTRYIPDEYDIREVHRQAIEDVDAAAVLRSVLITAGEVTVVTVRQINGGIPTLVAFPVPLSAMVPPREYSFDEADAIKLGPPMVITADDFLGADDD